MDETLEMPNLTPGTSSGTESSDTEQYYGFKDGRVVKFSPEGALIVTRKFETKDSIMGNTYSGEKLPETSAGFKYYEAGIQAVPETKDAATSTADLFERFAHYNTNFDISLDHSIDSLTPCTQNMVRAPLVYETLTPMVNTNSVDIELLSCRNDVVEVQVAVEDLRVYEDFKTGPDPSTSLRTDACNAKPA